MDMALSYAVRIMGISPLLPIMENLSLRVLQQEKTHIQTNIQSRIAIMVEKYW